jgi:hypothetical protein
VLLDATFSSLRTTLYMPGIVTAMATMAASGLVSQLSNARFQTATSHSFTAAVEVIVAVGDCPATQTLKALSKESGRATLAAAASSLEGA